MCASSQKDGQPSGPQDSPCPDPGFELACGGQLAADDQSVEVALVDEREFLGAARGFKGVAFHDHLAVALDGIVCVAVAQCGGGILCADVDGLAVDDGAQVAEDRVGEQGQIGAHVGPPS